MERLNGIDHFTRSSPLSWMGRAIRDYPDPDPDPFSLDPLVHLRPFSLLS